VPLPPNTLNLQKQTSLWGGLAAKPGAELCSKEQQVRMNQRCKVCQIAQRSRNVSAILGRALALGRCTERSGSPKQRGFPILTAAGRYSKAFKKDGKRKMVKTTPKAKNSVFMRAMQPSEHLAKIVGTEPLPRTEVTKKIWAYIKKHKLQNPKNKREILADDKLQPIFGSKKLDMFKMTKAVSQHLK
jgi:chromatin remodeling complex protein RSC6